MTFRKRATAAALIAAAAGVASVQAQPTFDLVYQTGNFLPGVGIITSPFRNSMPGFYDAAINNSGQMWVHVGMIGQPDYDEALLNTSTGLTPYLVEGNELYPLDVPSQDHVVDSFFALSINDAGDGGFGLSTQIVEFPMDPGATPTSGVFLNKNALVIEQGQATTFDPASTWDPAGPDMTVRVNNNDQWLVAHSVTGPSGPRRVIVRIDTDASGNVLSETPIAQEGSSVSGGAETWTELSTNPHSVAMNDSGDVIFTGRTSTGREGVFLNGAFVAEVGGPTPVGGTNWGELYGAAVDLNNTGDFVVRGIVGSTGTWTETPPDAGEDASRSFDGDRDLTGGGGPLNTIVGTLLDDHDVDVYRIRITDPANFSATTVGGPMEFDSVLWLLETDHNFNGIDRTGLARNDDANANTQLSTLGSTNVPAGGGGFYLAISTGKSRAVCNDDFVGDYAANLPATADLWQRDPSSLTLDPVSGTLYWADPSEGRIRSVTLPAAEGAALQVADVPTEPLLSGREIGSPVAFRNDGANSRVYFWADSDTAADGRGIRRVDLTGSLIEDVVPDTFGVTDTSETTALAIDNVRGKVYWSRRRAGQLWRANADGTSAELLIGAVGSGAALELAEADVVTPIALAVDEATGDVYAADPHRESIVRVTFPSMSPPAVSDFVTDVPVGGACPCERDGTPGVNVFDLLSYLSEWFPQNGMSVPAGTGADFNSSGTVDVFDLLDFLSCWFPASAGSPCGGGGSTAPVDAAGLAIDQSAHVIYFTNPTDGRVLKADLAGASAGDAVEVVGAGGAPDCHAIAVDSTRGKVYWTDIASRKIYSAGLDGSSAGVFFDIGPDTGDINADGDIGKRNEFSEWVKDGTAQGPALPYEIHLTGAEFALQGAMIAVNNTTKLVQFGDTLNVPVITDPNTTPPTTTPTPTLITYVSRTGQPVRISDNGDVLWLGEWGGFGFDEGLFLNTGVVMSSVVNPPGITQLQITTIDSGANNLDFSDNGRWATVRVTDGHFQGAGAGTQGQIRIDFGP